MGVGWGGGGADPPAAAPAPAPALTAPAAGDRDRAAVSRRFAYSLRRIASEAVAGAGGLFAPARPSPPAHWGGAGGAGRVWLVPEAGCGELGLLELLGRIMAVALTSRHAFPLPLHPWVWRRLAGRPSPRPQADEDAEEPDRAAARQVEALRAGLLGGCPAAALDLMSGEELAAAVCGGPLRPVDRAAAAACAMVEWPSDDGAGARAHALSHKQTRMRARARSLICARTHAD